MAALPRQVQGPAGLELERLHGLVTGWVDGVHDWDRVLASVAAGRIEFENPPGAVVRAAMRLQARFRAGVARRNARALRQARLLDVKAQLSLARCRAEGALSEANTPIPARLRAESAVSEANSAETDPVVAGREEDAAARRIQKIYQKRRRSRKAKSDHDRERAARNARFLQPQVVVAKPSRLSVRLFETIPKSGLASPIFFLPDR